MIPGAVKLKKISGRKALLKIEQILERVSQATTRLDSSLAATQARLEKVKALTTDGFWFFAKTYLPHWFSCASPEMHNELVIEVIEGGVVVVRWPRGFGKTILMQAIGLWLLLTGHRHYAIYIGRSKTASNEIVMTMVCELAANQRIMQDFGDQLTDRSSLETGFELKNGGWLQALPPLGVRGRRKGAHRPDLIVADDMEDRVQAANAKRVKSLIGWWFEDVIPSQNPRQASIIWLGTSLNERSALSLMLDPTWSRSENSKPPVLKRISRAAENEDGESVWPELWPLTRLMEMKAAIGPTAYGQEYLHLPVKIDGMFEEGWFVKIEPSQIPSGLIKALIVDPVAKQEASKSKDTAGIVALGKELSTQDYYILHCHLKRITGVALVKLLFDLHAVYHFNYWIFEMQTFAVLYKDLIYEEGRKRAVTAPLVIVEHHIPKQVRIQALQPIAEQRKFHYIPGHSHQTELIQQFVYFPSSTIGDDGPDASAMGYEYLKNMKRIAGDKQEYKTVKKRTFRKGVMM